MTADRELDLALKVALVEFYVEVNSRVVEKFTDQESGKDWWVQPDCSDIYEKAIEEIKSLMR